MRAPLGPSRWRDAADLAVLLGSRVSERARGYAAAVEFLRIILLCVAGAVLYGVVHDQVTVRVSPEYFTVGHARIIGSDSHTLIALAWGVVASWWMGLILGVPLAILCRVGRAPRWTARDLAPHLGVLLALMGLGATVAGAAEHVAGLGVGGGTSSIDGVEFTPDQRRHFQVAAAAHAASYTCGTLGAVALGAFILSRRRVLRVRAERRAAGSNPPPQ